MKTEKAVTRAIISAIVVGLIMAILAVVGFISQLGEQTTKTAPGTFGGLLNEDAGKPDFRTQEEIQKENEQRAPYTLAEQGAIEARIEKALSLGKWDELDRYLTEVQSEYRTGGGEAAQTISDWSAMIDMYRSDIAATQNLTPENGESTFQAYACPDVLAAAIAYSPISVKINAFQDWSAILLPPVPEESAIQTNIHKVTPENQAEILTKINEGRSEPYIDLVVFEMTLYGYPCTFLAVQNNMGYYRPYTLVSNIENSGFLDRSKVQEIMENLPSSTINIDEILKITPILSQ